MKNKRKNNPINYKTVSGQLKAETDGRKVSGYFAIFNTVDSDGDIIRPGAFAKSINERGPSSTGNRKIKYLHQHNIAEIAGPLVVLKEDEKGLYFEGELEKTPLGDIILERYKNGTYNEHSFGFRYVWDKCDWTEVPVEMIPSGMTLDPGVDANTIQVFECKELNLFEGSVVTFGANSQTVFGGFKGTRDDFQKHLNDELEFLLRKSPNFEFELQLRSLWSKQMSLEESLADANTKETKKPIQAKAIDLDFLTNNFNLNK